MVAIRWDDAALVLAVCLPILFGVPRLLAWLEDRDPHKIVWVVSWEAEPHTWLVFWSELEVQRFVEENPPIHGWGQITIYSGWVKELKP